MEETITKTGLAITALARRKGRGFKPTYHCGNCGKDRYFPCNCILGKEARKAELKRVKGKNYHDRSINRS